MDDKTAEAAKSAVAEDQVGCDRGPVQYQRDCRIGHPRLIERTADAGDKAARWVGWRGRRFGGDDPAMHRVEQE